MKILLIPPSLLLVQLGVQSLFGWSWPVSEPLLAVVVVHAFYQSVETRRVLVFAAYSGLWADFFSIDPFGLCVFSWMVSALIVARAARFVDRHNELLFLPAVFAGVLTALGVMLAVRAAMTAFQDIPAVGSFAARAVFLSLGSTIVVYPVMRLLKRCVPEFIPSS